MVLFDEGTAYMYRILWIVIIMLISIVLLMKYPKQKHRIYWLGLACAVIVIVVYIVQQHRIKTSTIAMCERNAMTLENQINGNALVVYVQDEKQLLFTDHVLMKDTCFSFDVVTYMDVVEKQMQLMDAFDAEPIDSPTYNSTLLTSNWGELFITEQHVQTTVEDGMLLLDGVARIEGQSGNNRDIYHLNLHYEYSYNENRIENRTIEIQEN